VGYTPHLTAAVWMGYAEADWVDPNATDCNHDQPDPEAPDACLRQIPPMSSDGRPVHGIRSMTGGQLPAQIWATFMTAATTNIPPDGFNEPTEELRQQGRPFGDGGPTEPPPPPTDTTLPPDTTPTTNVPTTPPITIEPPTSSTTDTTLFPFPTSTTPPDGGGGGRGP
jgi:membrane peptidoglycan carboxypeptidase